MRKVNHINSQENQQIENEYLKPMRRTNYEQKKLERSIKKLTKNELNDIVMSDPQKVYIDANIRNLARIELAKCGTYKYTSGDTDLILKYHNLLGHPSIPITIRKMKEIGLYPKLTQQQKFFCNWCLLNRPRKVKTNLIRAKNTERIWETIYTDVSGPHTPSVCSNEMYCVAFIEAISGFAFCYYTQSKHSATYAECFRQFLRDAKPYMIASGITELQIKCGTNVPQTIRSDGEKSYVGIHTEFKKVLKEHKFNHVTGAPYTHENQSKVERFFQTINKRAKALRMSAKLPIEYWMYAWQYVIYTYNLMDNGNKMDNISPVKVVTGKDYNERILKLNHFGNKVIITNPDQKATKDDNSKSTFEAIYLGPAKGPGLFYYLRKYKDGNIKILTAKHMVVDSAVPQALADDVIVNTGENDLTETDERFWFDTDLIKEDEFLNQNQNKVLETTPENPNKKRKVDPIPYTPNMMLNHKNNNFIAEAMANVNKYINKQVHNVHLSKEQEIELLYSNDLYLGQDIQQTANLNINKIHYSAAKAYEESDEYRKTDQEELNNLTKNDVTEEHLITSLTQKELSQLNMAHFLRYPKYTGEDGTKTIEKYKTRIVFNGTTQSIEQSGNNTASSTPRATTINMHFAMAPVCKNEVNLKADITAAFLKADQYTADGSRCFMRFPADMRQYNKEGIEIVYLLKKSLYGQRNSPLQFEKLFAKWATEEAGLIRSTVDPSVYTTKTGKVRLLQWVDDSHLRGDPEEANIFINLYEKKWNSKFEECDYFLNMRIRRDEDGYFNMCQQAYARELIKTYNMVDCRGAKTPLPPGTDINKESKIETEVSSNFKIINGKVEAIQKHSKKNKKPKETTESNIQFNKMNVLNEKQEIPDDKGFKFESSIKYTDEDSEYLIGPNLNKYKSAWGAISYYANQTRPDLAYAISVLGQVAAKPKLQHWRLIQHVLRYIKMFPDQGIRYSKPKDFKDHNRVHCYVDSNFAPGKSQTGYIYFMNGAPIVWASRKQSATATSSMEAEVAAACDAGNECKFINDLLYEWQEPMTKAVNIKTKNPIIFHEDNTACIVFNNTKSVTRRNRHMQRPNNFNPETLIFIPCAKRHVRQNYQSFRDLVFDGEAMMVKEDTSTMVADALTKALGPILFIRHQMRMTSYIPLNVSDNYFNKPVGIPGQDMNYI